VWSTGVPLLVPIYPQWAGRITSLIETSIGLGMMIGPSVGSALYSLGGYTTPFLVAAATQICFAIMCIFFLPNRAAENERQPAAGGASHDPNQTYDPEKPSKTNRETTELPGYTFVYFSTRPSILGVCFPTLCHAASMGFVDVAVGPYLSDKFGVGGETSGYYFLAYSGIYAILSPLLGLLIDRGYAGRIFQISCFGGALAFVMLYLPGPAASVESELWLIGWLFVLGAANAGGFTAIYLIFEKLAYRIGFRVENNVKLMTAALLNACFASGRMLGPIIIGGVFMDYFGYYYAFLLQGLLFLLSSVSCAYVLYTKDLLNKIYYPNQDEEEGNLTVKYESIVESLTVSGGMSKQRSATVTSTKSHVSSANFFIQSARYNPILSIKQSNKMERSNK